MIALIKYLNFILNRAVHNISLINSPSLIKENLIVTIHDVICERMHAYKRSGLVCERFCERKQKSAVTSPERENGRMGSVFDIYTFTTF